MAEGHIEFTLSMCVSVCVCVYVFQIHVQSITSLCMVGFKNYLAQVIIKNHVAKSKVKVTVGA